MEEELQADLLPAFSRNCLRSYRIKADFINLSQPCLLPLSIQRMNRGLGVRPITKKAPTGGAF